MTKISVKKEEPHKPLQPRLEFEPPVSPERARELLRQIGSTLGDDEPKKFEDMKKNASPKTVACFVCGSGCIVPFAENDLQRVICETCNRRPLAYEEMAARRADERRNARG